MEIEEAEPKEAVRGRAPVAGDGDEVIRGSKEVIEASWRTSNETRGCEQSTFSNN